MSELPCCTAFDSSPISERLRSRDTHADDDRRIQKNHLDVHCVRYDEVITQSDNTIIIQLITEYTRDDNEPEFVTNRLRKWWANMTPKQLISPLEVHGRMVTAKALMEKSSMVYGKLNLL